MCTRWPAIPKELWEYVTDYDRQWSLFNYSCAIIKWNKSIGFFFISSTTRKTNAITLWHFWMELNWSASCEQEESNHVWLFLIVPSIDCANIEWVRSNHQSETGMPCNLPRFTWLTAIKCEISEIALRPRWKLNIRKCQIKALSSSNQMSQSQELVCLALVQMANDFNCANRSCIKWPSINSRTV